MVKLYEIENGKRFDGVQWTGDKSCLPAWAKEFETEHHTVYGSLLLVGVYRVKPGSWLLRSHERKDIFPVPGDMFAGIYKEVANGDDA